MTPLRQRMLEDLKRHNLAESTQRSYLSFIARLACHFGVSPDQLTREQLDEFQHELIRQGRRCSGTGGSSLCWWPNNPSGYPRY